MTTLKILAAIATLTATAALAAAVPANAQMSDLASLAATTANPMIHKTGRKGRRIAAGIALGLIGAAALASRAHSADYDEDRSYRRENRCDHWRRWCRNGDDDACYRYDNRC